MFRANIQSKGSGQIFRAKLLYIIAPVSRIGHVKEFGPWVIA
jgi:hypothetical protein